MGNKIKLRIIFSLVFILAGAVISGLFLLFNYSATKNLLLQEIKDELVNVAEYKSKNISDYLIKVKRDILNLREVTEVKELLKEELVFNDEAIKKEVDRNAAIVSKEIENYIRTHPEMTLKDLQESSEFHKIAVQPVGRDGYSSVAGLDYLIHVHKYSGYVGTSIENNPDLKIYFDKLKQGEKVSEGFYDWEDISGDVRKKFGKFITLPVKTADGFELVAAVTAYVDDYRVFEGDDSYLREFIEDFGYYGLVLISRGRYIGHMIGEDEGLGTNLEWEINLNRGIAKNYFDVKQSRKISFYGPYVGSYGDIYPKVSIMAPVYEKDRFLGYIALISEMREVFDMINSNGSKENQESYIVDSNGLVISPFKFYNFDMFVQSIKDEDVEKCFSLPERLDYVGRPVVDTGFNYVGDEVVSAYTVISDVGWCLITEANHEGSIIEPLNKIIKKRIYLSLCFIFFLGFAGFLFGEFRYKKQLRKSDLNLEQEIL